MAFSADQLARLPVGDDVRSQLAALQGMTPTPQAPQDAPPQPPLQIIQPPTQNSPPDLLANVRAQSGAATSALDAPASPPQAPIAPMAAAQPAPMAGAPQQGAKPPKNPLLSAVNEHGAATQDNFDQQAENLRNQSENDRVQADLAAQQNQEANAQVEAQDEKAQAAHAERATRAQGALADLDKRAEALGSYQENPERYWNNHSRLLAGLAVGLGSVGGGENAALKTINANIDRDVAAQRATFAAKKDSYEAKNSLYGHMMNLYHDEDAAESAARVLTLDHLQRKAGELTAGNQSQQIQLKTQALQTALEQQKSDAKLQFAQQVSAATPKAAGAGGVTAKQISELAAKYYIDPNFTPAKGQSRAAASRAAATETLTGQRVFQGGAEPTVGKAGSNALSPRIATRIADQDKTIDALQTLVNARREYGAGGRYFGSEEHAKTDESRRVAAEGLGIKPEDLPDVRDTKVSGLVGADPIKARYEQMLATAKAHRANLAALGSKAGSGDEREEVEK